MPRRTLIPFRAAGAQPTADEFIRAQYEAQRSIDSIWGAIGSAGKITRQVIATGISYATPELCRAIIVRCLAGCGGGGGVYADGGCVSCGSGGAAGGYAESLIISPALSYVLSIGDGGAGGAGAYPTRGTSGGDTSFGGIVIAKGGPGGYGGSQSGGFTVMSGASGVFAGSVGDVIGAGQSGCDGYGYNSQVWKGGAGGGSVVGSPGDWSGCGIGGGADGNNASGYAAGGGGACAQNDSVTHTGGNGAPGLIIVDELY
jgi:hypothetical protein